MYIRFLEVILRPDILLLFFYIMKKSLILLAGIFVGTLIIYLLELVRDLLFPDASVVDSGIADNFEGMIERLPFTALLFTIGAYAIGSFCGGFITSLLSRTSSLANAILVGIVLLVFGLIYFFILPRPFWFVIVSLLLSVPCAYLGGKASFSFKNVRRGK